MPGDAVTGVTRFVQEGGTFGWQDFIGSNEAVYKRNAKDAETARDYAKKSDFFRDGAI